jgi:uncharacterized protein (DUF1778 family)
MPQPEMTPPRRIEIKPGPVPSEHLPGFYVNFLSAAATLDEVALDGWVLSVMASGEGRPPAAEQTINHQVRLLIPWRSVDSLIDALRATVASYEQMRQTAQ